MSASESGPPERWAGLAGTLFAREFLRDAVARTALPGLEALGENLRSIFGKFPTGQAPNEAQTEEDLIWPVLACLGWDSSLRQQNLTVKGTEHVPDGLLFADEDAKSQANAVQKEWERYRFGLAIVESKRWGVELDRGSGDRSTAPSTQMVRYLRRVDDLTSGGVRWGILANGALWRLYYAGARSVADDFFEIDLTAALAPPGRDALKAFALVFRREAFLPGAPDPRTFHQIALEEGAYLERQVADNLSKVVFEKVFPTLARAMVAASPKTPLPEVRDAALTLLYRLLFVLYAEDRRLLPVGGSHYGRYSLRAMRDDVRRAKEQGESFSKHANRYWSALTDLFESINHGDPSVRLPPYNGGLFDPAATPMLGRIRISDHVITEVIDALSFETNGSRRRYVNYRDLSVQQLGSIYERLLEQELARDGQAITVRPNPYARRGSGSYFTPPELVRLVLDETVGPLVKRCFNDFNKAATASRSEELDRDARLNALHPFDPAEAILRLRVCDPAMGSGHFLVGLVDYLADSVIAAMAEAEARVEGYASPVSARIEQVRLTIVTNADEQNWSISHDRLDDRHIVRRMVLKRCVYGVDSNPMAVELSKVSLWLHTFTTGAPLSFVDHHLKCGDSLFGAWTHDAYRQARRSPLFLHQPLQRATRAETRMREIEGLADAEIDESVQSAELFDEVRTLTAPLDRFLSLIHAFEWMNVKDKTDQAAVREFFGSAFGDPVRIATGEIPVKPSSPLRKTFLELLAAAQALAAERRFLHWELAFPLVWSHWKREKPDGGFDAIIGNPPWDRMKFQELEWFAARKPEIAHAPRASDRKRMVRALEESADPLALDFDRARERAAAAVRVARSGGRYPLLSGGDVNLYSLFVERALSMVQPDGLVGLLTPSGIASDKTAARFFRTLTTEGRLRAFYDFENRKMFFPDVHASFKFCVFVAGRSASDGPLRYGVFLRDTSEIANPERSFSLSIDDFTRTNPNTGTAPVFRSKRDADLTSAIYRRLPVLAVRSDDGVRKTWPVGHRRMFDMTLDSHLFRRAEEITGKEGGWSINGNRFDSPKGEWLPLYEGKMVQAFDHRAASVVEDPRNVHRPANPVPATEAERHDPGWSPRPRFWVPASKCAWAAERWVIGFKRITAPTNTRTVIATILPVVGFGNNIPIFQPENCVRTEWLLAGNLNAIILDYVARQKVHGQTLNLYIVEQLPVVPPDTYGEVRFGPKSAREIVRECVLELTYTAHDMEGFARDLGHVDPAGKVLPPFKWDTERRLHLQAKLDAVFFHLYGVTDPDDVRYVWSTFPNVPEQSRDLCLAYLNTLAAGQPDAVPAG